MTDYWRPKEPFGLPEDLRSRVGQEKLVRLLFEALHVAEAEFHQPQVREWLAEGRQRILWTLLTYAYATGLYSSEEIVSRIQTDDTLRYIAARTCPSADALRRFRRTHRQLLQAALSLLLLATMKPTAEPGELGREAKLRDVCDRAADQRIMDGIHFDSMALDY
jgi:hypothetical protein